MPNKPKPTKLKSGEPSYSGNPDDKFCKEFADKKVWHSKRDGQPAKSTRVPRKTAQGRAGHDKIFGVPTCEECGVEVLHGRTHCDDHKE